MFAYNEKGAFMAKGIVHNDFQMKNLLQVYRDTLPLMERVRATVQGTTRTESSSSQTSTSTVNDATHVPNRIQPIERFLHNK